MQQQPRSFATPEPSDAAKAPAVGPVPLDIALLDRVSGGAPKGGWEVDVMVETDPAPKGGW